jgi:hypothetical protein
MHNIKPLWAIPVLIFFISTTARADSTWTYTGNPSSGSQAINNAAGNGYAIDGTVTFAGATETNESVLCFTFTNLHPRTVYLQQHRLYVGALSKFFRHWSSLVNVWLEGRQ